MDPITFGLFLALVAVMAFVITKILLLTLSWLRGS